MRTGARCIFERALTRFRHARGWGAALIVAALVVGVALPVLAPFDRAVFNALAMQRGSSPGWAIAVARGVTMIGNLGARAVILVVGVLVFVLRRDWRRVAWLVIVTVAAGVLTDILKALFARPRPNLYPYIGEFSNYSFPSGHASNTMALLLGVGLLSRNRAFTAVCVVIALAVGTTRVMLDVHWPTDVIAGWLLGAGVALVGVSLGAGKSTQV